MTSTLGSFRSVATADPARARRALAFDALVGLAVAMLVWPFPVMRAALPWALHAPLLAAFAMVGEVAYASLCVAVWGRTPVMYLLDLGLDGAARPFGAFRALRWGAGFALAALVGAGAFGVADPGRGLPARLSGLRTSRTV